jgi:hypothetical protein
VIDSVDFYEVGEVLKIREHKWDPQYYIRWEEYLKAEYTWEPRKHLEGAEEALDEFYKKNPDTPREIPNGKGGCFGVTQRTNKGATKVSDTFVPRSGNMRTICV